MINVNERIFSRGDRVYIIDNWSANIGSPPSVTRADILKVNYDAKWFLAEIHDDVYIRCSFEDYGRLVFITPEEALEGLEKLPMPGTVMHQIIGNRVYKKTVIGFMHSCESYIHELLIEFHRGKPVEAKEIGNTVFYDRETAKAKILGRNK